MVAGTFNAYQTVDGVTSLSAAAETNGAAGTISLLFIAFAMLFGVLQTRSILPAGRRQSWALPAPWLPWLLE